MADGIPYPPSAPAFHFGGYSPGQSYRGDLYIGEGIAGLGQGIGQAVQNYQKNRAAHEQRDAVMNFLVENYPSTLPADLTTKGTSGETQPSFDALERYHAANENQKNKWMLQSYTAYTDMIRKQKQTEEMARANLANAQAAMLNNFQGPGIINAGKAGGEDVFMARTGPKQYQVLTKPQPYSPWAHTHVYDDKGNDVGIYDESGVPHYYHAENPFAQLLPFLVPGGVPGTGAPPAGGPPAAPAPGAPAPAATATPAPSASAAPSAAAAIGTGGFAPASTAGGTGGRGYPDKPTQDYYINRARQQMPNEQDPEAVRERAKQLARADNWDV